jgi:hypothetical protein
MRLQLLMRSEVNVFASRQSALAKLLGIGEHALIEA